MLPDAQRDLLVIELDDDPSLVAGCHGPGERWSKQEAAEPAIEDSCSAHCSLNAGGWQERRIKGYAAGANTCWRQRELFGCPRCERAKIGASSGAPGGAFRP